MTQSSRGLALVVGATSEIGTAVAASLSELGYSLVLWGRRRDRLDAVAEELRAAGHRCRTDQVDVTDRVSLRRGLERVADQPLQVLVWAVGIFDWAPAQQADPDAWASVLQTNLTAAAVLTASAMPALVRSAPSAMIFVGSAAGRRAFANNAAYVASKHGLAALAEATFLDVRDEKVKVSLIAPGLVSAGTGLMSPAGRRRPEGLLAPADVAAAVRFVVSFPERGCPTLIELLPQAST